MDECFTAILRRLFVWRQKVNQTRLEVSAALMTQVTANRGRWRFSINDVGWIIYPVHPYDDPLVAVEAFNPIALHKHSGANYTSPRFTDSRQKPRQKPISHVQVVVNSCNKLHSRR